MPPTYRHTQIGTVLVIAFIIGFLGIAAGWLTASTPLTIVGLYLLIFMAALALSGWMTIEVADGWLRWRLGIGLINGSASLPDIVEVQVVKNPLWYGWGMHLTPDGVLYNVSGTQALRIRLISGKTFRLGTDEPQKLLDVLDPVIRGRKSKGS